MRAKSPASKNSSATWCGADLTHCHSESRSAFERGEESAFGSIPGEKQIPRFARDDTFRGSTKHGWRSIGVVQRFSNLKSPARPSSRSRGAAPNKINRGPTETIANRTAL